MEVWNRYERRNVDAKPQRGKGRDSNKKKVL